MLPDKHTDTAMDTGLQYERKPVSFTVIHLSRKLGSGVPQMADPRVLQSVPSYVWVQLDQEPRIYVWHNDKETLDVAVDGFGNVMTSAPCIFRIGPPRSANVEAKHG